LRSEEVFNLLKQDQLFVQSHEAHRGCSDTFMVDSGIVKTFPRSFETVVLDDLLPYIHAGNVFGRGNEENHSFSVSGAVGGNRDFHKTYIEFPSVVENKQGS